MTPPLLCRIQAAWQGQAPTHDRKMLWAAFTLGFFGFLRAGEFTTPTEASFDPGCHLSPKDISVDSHEHPTTIRVHIKGSKTDPFHQGIHVFLGATDDSLCPVRAMLTYIVS